MGRAAAARPLSAAWRALSTARSATRTWASPVAVGQVLHGLAVAVAAQEVHAAVDARRVALQHPLDQADRLEVLAPVEGRRTGAGS